MSSIIKGILIVLLISGIGYFGLCVYAGACDNPASRANVPSENDANTQVIIQNTGTVYLTNNYEVFGDLEGHRFIVLHGYWRFEKDKFVFSSKDLPLDENIFGNIRISYRK